MWGFDVTAFWTMAEIDGEEGKGGWHTTTTCYAFLFGERLTTTTTTTTTSSLYAGSHEREWLAFERRATAEGDDSVLTVADIPWLDQVVRIKLVHGGAARLILTGSASADDVTRSSIQKVSTVAFPNPKKKF